MNRDVWSIYQEVRVPFTSPTWNCPGFYSFEVDFAEREEWYSQNTSTVLTPHQSATSSQYNAQKPKVSVRWQPLDPKYIGALILRGSYTEAFRAPQLFEMTPAGTQDFPLVADPFSTPNVYQVDAVLDLNGDGKLEVIVHSFYYEGGQTTIYRCQQDKIEEVLSVECGV